MMVCWGYINWGKLGWVAIETNNVQLVEGTMSWIPVFLVGLLKPCKICWTNWAWLRGLDCPFLAWLSVTAHFPRLISREFEAKLYHFWSFGITHRKYAGMCFSKNMNKHVGHPIFQKSHQIGWDIVRKPSAWVGRKKTSPFWYVSLWEWNIKLVWKVRASLWWCFSDAYGPFFPLNISM